MKKKICLLAALVLIISFSACGTASSAASRTVSTGTPDVSSEPSSKSTEIPAFSEQDGALRELAEEQYLPLIDEALEVIESTRKDELSKVTYPFEAEYAYSYPPEAAIALVDQSVEYDEEHSEYFDIICELVVENMPEDASAYDKYRYLGYFISLCTDYDTDASAGIMSLTPYGAVLGGESICLGFTYSFLYLCEKADLWCRTVEGFARHNGETHGWNLVQLEDGTYYVDITWCDGVVANIENVNWLTYFMCTEAHFEGDHGTGEDVQATGTFDYRQFRRPQ